MGKARTVERLVASEMLRAGQCCDPRAQSLTTNVSHLMSLRLRLRPTGVYAAKSEYASNAIEYIYPENRAGFPVAASNFDGKHRDNPEDERGGHFLHASELIVTSMRQHNGIDPLCVSAGDRLAVPFLASGGYVTTSNIKVILSLCHGR
jgi:hypothetical protein